MATDEPIRSTAGFASSADRRGPQYRTGWRALAAEARGGLVSALVSVPLAIGFGMFAFVGLGDQYFGRGALAGLLGAVTASLVCVILGARSGVVYAPRVVTTFFIGTLLLQHVGNADAAIIVEGGVAAVLAIVGAIVFLGGALQLAFGALRIGSLIRFTPQPVIAGFQNCAVLMLVIAQAAQVLGVDTQLSQGRVLDQLHEAKPLSVAVAIVAALGAWHARRWVPRTPPLLFGLIAGTIVFYAFAGMAGHDRLGPVIGTTPPLHSVLDNIGSFIDLAADPRIAGLLPLVLSGALSIAIIASVDALLCARLLDMPGMNRTSPDRELNRLGAANMIAACAGGLTAGCSYGPTLVNRSFGGRGAVSVLVNAAVTLALLAAAMPLIAYLPRAALSGVIVVIGLQNADRWSLRVLRQLFVRDASISKSSVLDLLVVTLVAAVAILVDLVSAVMLGVALSVVFFLARMSRSIVRRAYRANAARSRKMRDPDVMQFLAERGSNVLILELDGALFFGSAERLGECLDRELAAAQTRYVVFDFKRVTEVDSTGAEAVRILSGQLADRHAELIVCGVVPGSAIFRVLQDSGVVGDHGAAAVAIDLDRAIEYAEQALIDTDHELSDRSGTFPLGALALLRRMDRRELALVRSRLERRSYAAWQVVFDQGEPGDRLFIVVAGSASARMIEGGRERRLMTFGPGGIFGEMGFLDRSSRSATVVADEDLQCLVLQRESFDALSEEHPGVAIKLLAALGKELSTRLRLVNRTIVQLET